MPSPASSSPASTRDRAGVLHLVVLGVAGAAVVVLGCVGMVLAAVVLGVAGAIFVVVRIVVRVVVHAIARVVLAVVGEDGGDDPVVGALVVGALALAVVVLGIARGEHRLKATYRARAASADRDVLARPPAAMRLASRLMPRTAGRRWLEEAESYLFEAPPAQRRRAIRNYLTKAPQVIAATWAGHLARRIRAR